MAKGLFIIYTDKTIFRYTFFLHLQKTKIMKKVLFACCGFFALTAFTTTPNISSPNEPGIKVSVQNGTPLYATLLGSNEFPVLGDPDGEGYAEITLNQGQGTITYTINVEGIDPAAAAHIHFGMAGTAGPVVVGLNPPTNGMVTGVAYVDKELIKAIRQNPSAYYVNVHNAQYPGGALRGQLSK